MEKSGTEDDLEDAFEALMLAKQHEKEARQAIEESYGLEEMELEEFDTNEHLAPVSMSTQK